MNKLAIAEPEVIGMTGGLFSGRDGMYSNHLSSIISLGGGRFRIYLCRRFWFDDGTTRMDMGYCDSDSLTKWPNLRAGFKPVVIQGLPDGCRTAHPNVISKGDGYEMFFWVHGNGMVRYVKACGTDGAVFSIENLAEPCLYHPGDFRVASGGEARGLLTVKNHSSSATGLVADSRSPEACRKLVSNDATSVIYDSVAGRYVMYTVYLLSADLMPERRVQYDNAANWLRVIHRRQSRDGLCWSDSEPLVLPEKEDPVDLQFYSMVAQNLGELQVATLGYYPVKEQVLDLMPAVCANGVWARNRAPWRLRGELSLAGKPVRMIFPGAIVRDGDDVIISGTCCSYFHNEIGHLKPEEYVQANALFRLPMTVMLESAGL